MVRTEAAEGLLRALEPDPHPEWTPGQGGSGVGSHGSGLGKPWAGVRRTEMQGIAISW